MQRRTLDAFEIAEAPRHRMVPDERGCFLGDHHLEIPPEDFLPFEDVPESEFFV